ncbi:MAG: hypothetical protein OXG15_10900 [Gammaproteobacteria bacterium]|nr:hypothetical protein [Gammaproteobacteria bacterium]
MPRPGGTLKFLREARAAQAAMPKKVQIGYFGDSAIDALMNEFGIPGKIPERPALRPAFRQSLNEINKELAKMLIDSRTMSITEKDALKIGQIMADNLRLIIIAGVKPQNAAWKNTGTPPLVFTKRLLKSIDVKVIK